MKAAVFSDILEARGKIKALILRHQRSTPSNAGLLMVEMDYVSAFPYHLEVVPQAAHHKSVTRDEWSRLVKIWNDPKSNGDTLVYVQLPSGNAIQLPSRPSPSFYTMVRLDDE